MTCFYIFWYYSSGGICTVVNDRLRRKMEIYGFRIYGDRIKIQSDWKVKFSTPYTELYDCCIRSYMVVYGYTFTNWCWCCRSISSYCYWYLWWFFFRIIYSQMTHRFILYKFIFLLRTCGDVERRWPDTDKSLFDEFGRGCCVDDH